MPQPKFLYNNKTLRFEKAGFPWRWTVVNGLGLIFTAGLFFAGLVFLENRIIDSPLEKTLSWENKVLQQHKEAIEAEAGRQNELLASLSTTDRSLHKRILGTEPAEPEKTENYSKSILAGSVSEFYALLDKLGAKTKSSYHRAREKNYIFAKLYWPGKKDVDEIKSFPTIAPLPNFKIDLVACGFGNQINPFNKLLYDHNGIDLAGERGSDILAAGSGTVEAAVISEMPTGLGTYVTINHGNGYITRYAHLQSLSVYPGQIIKQGHVIGKLGMSGGVVAPHLHYEIIKNGRYYNPALFIIGNTGVENFMSLAEIGNKTKQALD